MNKWMLSAAGAVMMVCAGVSQAEISDDPATVSDQIFRAGVAYCNSAVKVSRSDSRQARSDINQYQAHVGRAQSIYPALLDQNDYARREHQRCSQIGENIARAEALPVIEKGLAMCQDARSALRQGDARETRLRYSQYEMNRDRALRMSESVLKVGSIAVQVRICDGLTDRVAALTGPRPVNALAATAKPAPTTNLPETALVGTGNADL